MSVYDIVTKKIIEQLEKGIIPWQRPWTIERPRNISGRSYSGVNLLLLADAPYSCPIWATFRQIKEKGGKVKAGEKSRIVVFYKTQTLTVVPDDMTQEEFDMAVEAGSIDPKEYEKTVWLLRYYRVFNLEQTTLDVDKFWQSEAGDMFAMSSDEAAEEIINNMPNRPSIIYGGNKACYLPDKDEVRLPAKKQFYSLDEYYYTCFHELAHSTGHPSRLNRKTLVNIAHHGDELYSKEELIAELSASFLLAECGLDLNIENRASYISGWLNRLRNDKRIIIHASSQAEKAMNFILGY